MENIRGIFLCKYVKDIKILLKKIQQLDKNFIPQNDVEIASDLLSNFIKNMEKKDV